MKVDIKLEGLKELQSKMTDLEKNQMPFALAKSLTDTAKDVKGAELRQMGASIRGGATSYTKRGLYFKSATKKNLQSEVGFKDSGMNDDPLYHGVPAAKYMYTQVEGGKRNIKRFEAALKHKGILPNGMYITPGIACMRDSYGNIPHGFIMHILSYFEASERWSGHTSNMTAIGRLKLKKGTKKKIGFDYIVSGGKRTMTGRRYTAPQHLPPGIYKREYYAAGTRIRPVLMFVRNPSYQKRFPFYETAKKIAHEKFQQHFSENMANAIKTAK